MPDLAIESVRTCLLAVDAERARRAADPVHAAVVHALKRYQQARFARSYEDLLASARYRNAATFFLDDLYGPRDFAERDAQFARVAPKVLRLFPEALAPVVTQLAELHALSEHFDGCMADELRTPALTPALYVQAWRAVGDPDNRSRQLALVQAIGHALDRLADRAWLLGTLRMMRRPAQAAGLGQLQAFLETGLAAFRSMRGATDFLAQVQQRERRLLDALFDDPQPPDDLPPD